MKITIQRVVKFFILLLFILVIQSCNQGKVLETNNQHEVHAIDSRGKDIKLSQPATRVIALYESIVDDIFMLDAQDKLVGIPQQVYLNEDTYTYLSQFDSRFANKEIPTPTFTGGSSNVEGIVGLQPDLVVTFSHDADAIAQLEALGIAVYTISSKDEVAIISELEGMATLLGKTDRAKEIISYVNDAVDSMKKETFATPKKVYYAWSKGRVLSTSGKGTLMDMAINLSGAINACPLDLEAPNVGAETLYKWNPNIIILWNSSADDVYNLSELASLPAVINKEVKVMKPAVFFDPHTVKFILFAKQVRNWCYPEVYDTSSFEEDMKKALTVFYPSVK